MGGTAISVTISQSVRKGKTKYENILSYLFTEAGISTLRDKYICLKCGGLWNLREGKYPDGCKECGKFSNTQGQFMMPDLIISNYDNPAVIFVNGFPHTKDKRKKKDNHQIKRLLELGYKVFVFENSDVITLSNQKKFLVNAMLKGLHMAIRYKPLYQQLFTHEREMIGVKHILES